MAGSLVTVSETAPLRVLLAEDNSSDVAILEHILTGMDIELRHCPSLAELERQGETWDPDVVLLNLHLEGGQDFMVTARTVVSMFPNVPVLAFTNLDDEAFALRALQVGLSMYLIKGTFSGADLMRAIKEAQARKHALHCSLPPTFRREDLQEMVQEAVQVALRKHGKPARPERATPLGTVLGVIVVVLLLLGGAGAWGYYQIRKIRTDPKPDKEIQQDKKADQVQEFQRLRNAFLKKQTHWESGGKLGVPPKKPERLLQLEQELAN